MPASATVTAFNEFTPKAKTGIIKSSEVDANFDVFRGHVIPIDPTAAAGADNSYDLGSSEYYWRNAYIKNLGSATSQLPSIQKYTFSFSDFQTAAASAAPQLFSNPTSGVFTHIWAKHSTAFSGGGISGLKVKIGDSNDDDKYMSEFDVTQAVTATAARQVQVMDVSFNTATSILITASATGADLDSLTAGDLDVWIMRGQLG